MNDRTAQQESKHAAPPSDAVPAPSAWMLQEPGQSKRWYTSGETAMQHWVSKGAIATPLYAAPVAPAAAAPTDKREAFEAWAKPRGYDLTSCSPVAYAAYKSDLTNGALAGWLGALDPLAPLSTETVDKPVQRMSDAERDVLTERVRQVTVEGWTPIHDDHHDAGQMAAVAGYYALACSFPHSRDLGRGQIPAYWPWDKSWWKPTTARRNLVKAGALIIAEIERIDRAGSSDAQDGAQ